MDKVLCDTIQYDVLSLIETIYSVANARHLRSFIFALLLSHHTLSAFSLTIE